MTENVVVQPNKPVSKDVIEAVNLLAQGKRNIMCGEMSHAVAQLQEACKILGAEYGELADECADAYFWYGKSLLEVSRMESGVFGDAIPGESEEDSQSSDDDEADEAEEAAENGSNISEDNNADGAENDSVASEDIENEETGEANESNTVAPNDEGPSTSTNVKTSDKANSEATKQGGTEDVSSLQLAWEMLELSKLIYKRHTSNEMKLKLADTYLKLGEIGLETEQYDQSISDLSDCLEIQRSLLADDDRCLAETLFQLGLACTFDRRYDSAITHYRAAIDVLEKKIAQLRRIVSGEANPNSSVVEIGSFDSPADLARKEIDELSSILPDLFGKIEDIEDERRSAPQVQSMMKETVAATTSDSMSRIGGNCDSGLTSSSSSSTSTAFQSSFSDSAFSSSQPVVHNITHLVRKKRKSDTEESNTEAVKKVKLASDSIAENTSVGDKDSEGLPSSNGFQLVVEETNTASGIAGESDQSLPPN